MTKDKSNLNDKKYDLEERTACLSEDIIDFTKKIPITVVTKPIISQLIRSGTSIGANYCEADGAESKKDFKHKIGICKKEAKETKYWLRMVVKTFPTVRNEARLLWKEAHELVLIFSAIIRK